MVECGEDCDEVGVVFVLLSVVDVEKEFGWCGGFGGGLV